ncbi:hypothetical protein [Massilia aerilata]|uniref:Uncharacterized protein n=1 Tax=Massilia aerilata TaxID=453817 RepID=A0ABW0S055_9BURK
MSLYPQAPKKPDDFAFKLLSFPFDTLEAIGSRIANAFTSIPKQQPKEPAPAPVAERIPDITANQQYMVADRVYRTEVCGRNVSFYQYHAAQVIRISCRELRHLKPLEFTPAIAEGAALVYDIDGAIQWVRQTGLDSNSAKHAASKAPARPVKGAAKTQSPPWDVTEEPVKAKPVVQAAANAPLKIVPANGNKSVPFTGKIVSFGTTRIGGDGRKPYWTYAMTLRSETGSYEKQFIGEHLADLVTDLGLQEGQLVRLQLLGKHHFEVEVNGKMEERCRNHYAIDTL